MKQAIFGLAVAGLVLALLAVAGVYAQGPVPPSPPVLEGGIQASDDTINFQGRLYTAGGAPVPAGNYNLRFTICSASDCSSTVWGPTEFTAAVDAQGLFNVLLTPLNADHFTGNRWLRIEVCNTANQNPCTSGWDTMTPYQPMTSVAISIGNIRKNVPDTTTANTAGYVLTVNNSGSGSGLSASGWYGLYGNSPNGGWGVYGTGGSGVWGVQGWSPDSYGVYGVCNGDSYGVYGVAYGTAGIGVAGYNAANIGVYGRADTGDGLWGYASSTTADNNGVFGFAATTSPYAAPAGVSTGATGSVSTSGDYGVFGLNTATANAYGVVGAASGTVINLPPAGTGAGVVGSMGIANDYGVWGYNSATGGGWGVWGGSAGTTGGAAGVMGINTFAAGAGQSSIGVVGVAGTGSWTYFTGSAVGVLGSVARSTDYGVLGYNSTTTGGTGVYGQGFTGVVGYSAYARGVFGQTDYTTSARGQAVVGYASATGASVHGVYGVAGTTTWFVPDAPAGVAGYVNATNGIGVWGYNGNTTGGGYGLYGYTVAANSASVYGRADGATPSYGVAGHHYWGGVGVGAWSYSGDIMRGYSGDYPGGTLRMYLTNSGNLYVDGGYYIFLNPPGGDPNAQSVLATIHSPEVWVEDFGTATLVDGRATVTIASDLAAAVNLNEEYHVFLTPRGDCQGLYVAATTPTSFEVRELGGGKSNVAFDYRIVAKRQGLENLRMQPVPEVAPSGKVAPAEESPTIGVIPVEGAGLPSVAPATATGQQAPPTVQQARPVQVPAAPVNRPK
ncbi:MAG: hypothetical protein ACP5NB_07335 [Chloroflexia bacterium]